MKNTFTTVILLLITIIVLTGQGQMVSGTITGDEGEPLVGASVLVKDAPIGTTTATDGTYQLEVPDGFNTLVFSFIGFEVREVNIDGRQVVDLQLKEYISAFDEVVVVGFGSQNKRRVTSAISSVGEEVFKNVPVSDFQNALQGRMPGVVISNSSGLTNSDVSIRIRGVGSISAGNQPLVVVDGLVLSGRINAPYYGNFGGFSTNPFINLNPNDIESVEVLKDAAAAAIYGSRGSNGVILITTKRGGYNSQPKVHVGYFAGFTEPIRVTEFLNGPEYARLLNQAAENIGEAPVFQDVENQPSSDWLDLTLRRGFVQEATAGVSGGTKTTKYYFGGTARDEESYLKTMGFQRYSIRANIDQMLGDKVTVGLSVNPSRTQGDRKGNFDNPFYQATFFAPNIEAFDENGEPVGGTICNGVDCYPATPLINLTGVWSSITSSQVLFNSYIDYAPIPSLSFRTSFSSEYTQIEELFKYGAETWMGMPSGYGTAYNQQTLNYNWAALATWQNTFGGKHHLDVSAGVHVTKEALTGLYLDGGNFADNRLRYLGSAAQVASHSTSRTQAGFTGILARANYDFNNKYLLTLSARYDGSSRFGAENRYGFFPAVSAGWILSDEDFLDWGLVDFLKLRSSYGVAGNAGIGDFASRGLVQFGRNYNGLPGYTLRSIENEALGWEKNVQWDAGLEFALWDNRLRGTLGYYIKDTKDLLLEAPVPATNGITVLSQNAGAVRNQGFEFSLEADILKGPLQWTVQANGATLKNEVRQLVDADRDGTDDDINTLARFLFRPGLSIGTFFLVEYAGVDPSNGDALFWNADRTEKLANQTPSENRRLVGKALPDFTGGFSSAFRYKNFDLSAFFQFKAGYEIYWLDGQACGPVSNSANRIRECALDAWTPENPNTNIPQARLNQVNGEQRSSRNVFPGDHLRLNNLTLGYTFPALGKRKYELRLYAAAQNLVTFTDFPALDPDSDVFSAGQAEKGAILGNPPARRMFTFGFNLDL